MPISDEIIELEPVKKNKSKLIVMFVIMGVLLALAATFLVLWIVKPNVEPITDKVTGVTLDVSALFNTSADDAQRENVASIGNEYEISATVSTEGDGKVEIDKTIVWTYEPYNAIAKHQTVFDEGTSKFKFTPSADYAGEYVTINARSMSDADYSQSIRVKIIKQGTEEVKLLQYWRSGAASTARTDIRNNEIEVPLYATSDNNRQFYVTFEQFGAWDESTQEYSKLTIDGDSNKIDIDVSDSDIISKGTVNENGSPARFEFTPRGLGVAEITITANAHNDFADPLTVKLKVTVKSNAEKRYIDKIYVVDRPVDAEFLKSRVGIAEADWFKNTDYNVLTYGSRNDKPLVLPYNGSYNEILSHLVISPLTVQYNAEKDELYNDWISRIKVESSNALLKVTRSGNEKPNITGSGLVNGDECSLTFSDVSSSSIGVEQKIRVNVVANNAELGGEVSIGDKNDAWLTNPNNKVETSPNAPVTMRVTYTFTAPDSTDADTMLSKGYVSTGFIMTMSDPDAVTVKVGETTIESGRQYDFTKSLVITKPAGKQNTFIGTADISITFNESAEDGAYTIQFHKIGTTIDGADSRFNALNPDWNKSVNFNVTKIATKAEFRTKEEILEIVSDHGSYAADFILDRPATPEGEVWKSTARLFLQHRPAESEIGFDFADLVKKHGTGDTFKRLNATAVAPFNRTQNIDQLKYTADLSWSSSSYSLSVTIEQRNSSNIKIAELNVTVYVIDAVKAIAATAKDDTRETIYNADDYGSKNLGDSLSFEKVFGAPETTKRDLLSDVDITLSKSGTVLDHDWDASSTVEYKYDGDTVFYYDKASGNIRPARDLFAYGYEANIAMGEIKVTYRIAKNAWQKAVSQDVPFTFKRAADDVYVYGAQIESYLDEYKLSGEGTNIYTCYVNQRETLNLYATSVVKYGTGVSAKTIIIEDKDSHTGHAISSVVRAYLSVNDTFKDFINSGSTDSTGKLYYNFSFTSPDVTSSTGTDSYEAALIVYGSSKTKSLEVKVQNLSRPIENIELFNAEKITSTDGGAPTYECGSTKLTESNYRFVFGSFNNAPAADGMPYIETFFITITYSALDGDQSFTRFEPVSLQLPHYISYRLGLTGEYVQGDIVDSDFNQSTGGNGVWNIEIAKPAIDADLKNPNEIKYTVQCFIRAIPERAYDVEGGVDSDKNRMEIYASYHDSSSSLRQRIPVSVLTGLSDIKYYIDNRGPYFANTDGTTPVECALSVTSFDQSASPKLELSTDYIGISAGDGYRSINYNSKSNLSWVNRTDDFGIFEGTISENGLSITIDLEKLKALTADKLQQYIDGKVFTFVLRDTAGGGSKDFTISVKIKVDVKIVEFAIDGDSYSIVTNGKTDGSAAQSDELSVTLNNGIANALITEEERGRISFEICEVSSNGAVTAYTGGDISISGNRVLVKNDFLTSEQKYYVRAKYVGSTAEYSEPVKLIITTSASKLVLADSGNISVETVDGSKTATVKVKNSSEAFRLAAVVRNSGDDKVVGGANISYALYSDANAQNPLSADIAGIDSFGDIKFSTNLNAHSGTFYYRASYLDNERGGYVYTDIVTVNYSVSLTDVGLVNAPLNDTYTFYYYAGATTGYTTLVLNHSDISTEIAFAGITASGVVYRITNDSQKIIDIQATADKFTIVPKGEAGEAHFTLTAEYNGTAVEKPFTVNVVIVPALELSADRGTINVFKSATEEGGKVTFMPKALNTYDGLSLNFTAECDGKILKNVNAATGEVTLTLDRSKFDAGADETYNVTLTATYGCADSLLSMANPIVSAANFTLTVSYESTYVPSFEFTAGGIDLAVSPAEHEINKTAADGYYQIRLKEPTGVWYVSADWAYSATSANSPIDSIDNIDGGVANVALKAGVSGATAITLSATAYGKTFTSTKNYVLVDSGAVSAELKTTYNSDTSTVTNGASLASDFTSTANARTFVYTIDASGLGIDVSADNVRVDYSGYVTMTQNVTETAENSNVFTVAFRADKAFGASGAFTIRSSVIANGKTYYPTTGNEYTVTLTATAAEYSLNADARILPDETTAFTVANKGDATVLYSIVSGGDYATVDTSTGILKPKTGVAFTVDSTVLVRASVTVANGAFAGRTYTFEKAVVIVGVPKPDIIWDGGIDKNIVLAESGVAVDMSQFEISSVTAVGKTEKTYTYTSSSVTYNVTAQGLTQNADYSVSGNTLTVNKTNNTMAGGRFVVIVTAVLSGGVNGGESVTSEPIEFVIVPQAKSEAVTVTGAVGTTYDIYDAVKPYVGVGENQIKSTDGYTVSYALKTPDSKISVDGRYLTVVEFVSYTSVQLTATVTMTSGKYAGTVMTVDAVVNLNVFTADVTDTVVWRQGADGAVGGYDTLDVASLLGGKFGSKTVSEITVDAISHGAFIGVTGNGSYAPVVNFANDINVTDSANAETVTLAYTVKCTDNSVYYGRGTVNVAAIAPELSIIVDGISLDGTGGAFSYNVEGGSSFGLELRETHGLPVDGIEVDYDGGYLQFVTSGAHMVVTAADADSAAQVGLTASVCGLNVVTSITVNISERQTTAAYSSEYKHTQTSYYSADRTLALAGGSTTNIEFRWTASTEGSTYRYPYTMAFATGNNNSITSVKAELYRNNSIVGTYDAYVSSSSTTLNLYSGSSWSATLTQVDYIIFTVGFNTSYTTSYNLNMTLRAYNTSNTRGSSTSTQVTYSVSVGTANITLKNMNDIPGDGSVAVSAGMIPDIAEPNAKVGHTFAGWYRTYSNGRYDNPYTPAHEYYGFTLYAKWEPATYSVSLDVNGGNISGTSLHINATYNGTYSALGGISAPTRTGYEFAGWYTQPEGGNHITPITSVTATGDHTLYAHWTPNVYSVAFNPDNGSANIMTSVTYGEAYTAPATPVRAGYNFEGWYTEPTGGSKIIFGGVNATRCTTAEHHSLYAHWTAETYEVLLDYGYVGSIGGRITVTFDKTFGDADGFVSAPTRVGYTFVGWFATDGKMIAEGTKVGVLASGYTLTARWVENAPVLYTVTFDVDATTYASQTVVSGGKAMRPQNPEKIGYDFIGWFADGASTAYDFTSNVTADITLTARFELKTFDIALELDGGEMSDGATSINVQYDADGFVVDEPTKTDCTFDGWYGSADFAENTKLADNKLQFEDGTPVYTTLYAKWTEIAA